MPSPRKKAHARTGAAAFIRRCSSRNGARMALWFGFDRHRIGDDLQLLTELRDEFAHELPASCWLTNRITELETTPCPNLD